MKIIQMELFNLPPDQLLKQCRLPEPPKMVLAEPVLDQKPKKMGHALSSDEIRAIAQHAIGQPVSDRVIAQALVHEFLSQLPKSNVQTRRETCLN